MNKHLHNSKKSCNFAGIFMRNKAELTKKQQNIMKRNIFRVSLWCGICMAMTLVGCKADVDLGNIDTTTKVEANLALPIGSVNATLGDFVGDGTWGIYVEELDNGYALAFKDTFSWVRPFHNVNLSQYISRKTLPMKVYDKLENLPFFIDGKITGNDHYTIPLEFPLTLHLNGINNDEDYQRLDSALIKNASFISTISRKNLPLDWDWVEKVTIKLGDAFTRPDGNIVTVYQKGVGKQYGYDQDIPINVDEFSMNLMKNRHPSKWEDFRGNVVDSCNFLITMYIKIPSSAGQITIPKDAEFQYKLGVQFIDYYAVWGMFKASGDMSDDNEIVLEEEWDGYRSLGDFKLPLADPRIDVSITTQIAGALVLHGDHLYVVGSDGDTVHATFNDSRELYKYYTPSEYLSLNSSIGDSATMHLLFDKDRARGRLDQLFTVHPEKIGYKYSVDFNRQETPQIRIGNNAGIRLDAACTIPFVFNEGIALSFSDTITDIDLSQLRLDSLLANVQVIDTIGEATLKLALGIENGIPLQFKLVLNCLDSLGNLLMDSEDTTKPFRLTGQDTILIASSSYEENNDHTWTPKPIKTTQIITVTEELLNTFSQVKSIVLELSLDDESLQEAYKNGLPNIRLTDTQNLRIGIGVGANIKALLNLDGLTESNNQPQ